LPSLFSLGDVIRRPNAAKLFNGRLDQNFGLSGPIMLDSGGFTLTQVERRDWTWKTVLDFYQAAQADHFVSLDYPPARGDDQTARISKIRRSATNFVRLYDAIGANLIPVIHGRSLGEIDLACALTANAGFRGAKVGIGGLVPLLQQTGRRADTRAFIVRAVRTVRQHFPDSGVHVFGAGSPQTIQAMFTAGASTVDSIAWRRAAAFGAVYVDAGAQRLLPGAHVQNRSRPILTGHEIDKLGLCRCPSCARQPVEDRLRILATSFRARALHNAWTIGHTFSDKNQASIAPEVSLSDGWIEALSI
jgi:tRNA-guanine family transglycosylase